MPYLIPSHDPDSERFESRRYWRGPIWAFMNMLIGVGMAEANLVREAETIRGLTTELIGKSGFSEYFDSLDGSSAGGSDFTWTAAVWLAWLGKREGKSIQWA